MSIALNNIAKIKTNSRKRVGRGIGSGTGKTSGHGVKGQKARSGVAIKGFEGGQTPIYMRLPKKGFNSNKPEAYEVVNFKDVSTLIESKKIDGSNAITKEKLFAAGLISNKNSKVKLIVDKAAKSNNGITFQVDFYSKQAKVFAA